MHALQNHPNVVVVHTLREPDGIEAILKLRDSLQLFTDPFHLSALQHVTLETRLARFILHVKSM